MDYLISKIVLMVTGIALSRGRHFVFCLWFFYVWALYKLGVPDPKLHAEFYASWPALWYFACMSAEAAIFYIALIIKPNARTLIILASTVQIAVNSISVYSHVLYGIYPIIIRTCEIAQCLTLIIWSPIALSQFSKLRIHLKGMSWMLRLLKQ
jgi:hypothetical protein